MQQLYKEQLVRCLEAKGIRPIPTFFNNAALHVLCHFLNAH